MLFSLTSEAVAGLVDSPIDRLGPASKLAEAVGGKIETYYWMLGQYDGLVIFSLPDSASVAALSIVANSTGAYSRIETHELISTEDLVAVLQKAQTVKPQFLPPGQSAS
jgi:uncharacterized protein with GYD domain